MVEYKKLSELVDIHIGKTPSRANLNYWGGNEPWISISDMKQKYILTTKEYITQKAVQDTNIFLIPEGTLLMSFKLSIGKLGFTTKPMFSNEAIAALIIKDNTIINKNYLYYSIQNTDLTQNTDKAVKGLTLNKAKLKELKIACHPLEDQQRIVKILDKAEEIRTKKKLANEKLDEFLKSTFIDMFGDPVLNTKNYIQKKVIDVCDCMVPARDKPKSFSGDIPWITIEDLVVNGFTQKSRKDIGLTIAEIEEVKRKCIPAGSVIMSCVGNLGICSIAGKPMVINQQLHSFQCMGQINNIFLMYYLGFRQDYMNKHASNTTVLYMNKTVCNSIPVIIPPIEQQNQFAQIVQKVEAQKEKNQKVIEQMDNLFNSLMQQAFKGKI